MAPRKRPDVEKINTNILGKTEPAPQQDTLPEGQQDAVTPKQPGVKVTYYLDPDTVARLDMGRVRLRGMLTPGERGAVTLSAIVDAALSLALDDLENMGAVSRLAVKMASQRDSEGA